VARVNEFHETGLVGHLARSNYFVTTSCHYCHMARWQTRVWKDYLFFSFSFFFFYFLHLTTQWRSLGNQFGLNLGSHVNLSGSIQPISFALLPLGCSPNIPSLSSLPKSRPFLLPDPRSFYKCYYCDFFFISWTYFNSYFKIRFQQYIFYCHQFKKKLSQKLMELSFPCSPLLFIYHGTLDQKLLLK
jgi:hypothetical protein